MHVIKKSIKFNNQPTNIIFNIKSNYYDIGFYTDSGYDSTTIPPVYESKKITGFATSRLMELEKYSNSTDINKKYKISINSSNGVILSQSNDNQITYIIDNIKYVDDLISNITTFEYNTPVTHSDIENKILVKEDNYLNYSDKKTDSNLDIVRQSLNIFESHIRLSDIRNLEELTLYGGGYYNIIKNS